MESKALRPKGARVGREGVPESRLVPFRVVVWQTKRNGKRDEPRHQCGVRTQVGGLGSQVEKTPQGGGAVNQDRSCSEVSRRGPGSDPGLVWETGLVESTQVSDTLSRDRPGELELFCFSLGLHK